MLSALPTQGLCHPEAGLVTQVGQASTCLLHSFPTPSLSFSVLPCPCHPCTPGIALSSSPRCSPGHFLQNSHGSGSGSAMGGCGYNDCVRSLWCWSLSGSSDAGIQSTTEMMSVTQQQLDVSSSHACDVRLH